uniref:GYF domain-containing protein n=1 Tax=Panagrolaimus superbus TaxID=310955 RepID=A0A914YT86_9BILA
MGEYTGIERDMNEDLPKWAYLGEDDQEHAWFTDNQMQKWYETGYFTDNLQVRTIDDGKWFSLQEYMQLCGGISPFLGGVTIEYDQHRRPQYTRNNDFYEQQRQQQITPVPMNIPLHHHLNIPGYTAPTSAITSTNGATPLPYFVNTNSFAVHPMLFPPGMEQYDESQMYQNDGYGNERENPSSSSVSETPDSERCLHIMEEMKITLPTFDKCVGTEDAPWLPRTIECGTDTPKFPSTGTECGVQTNVIFIKPKEVSRLLKEITGINFYVR